MSVTWTVSLNVFSLFSVFISVSHVHRSKSLWKRNPFSNIWWSLTLPFLWVLGASLSCAMCSVGFFYFPDNILCLRVLAQGLQTALDLQLWTNPDSPLKFSLWDIPLLSWLSGSLSLLVVLIINEIVKLHEIRYFFFPYKGFSFSSVSLFYVQSYTEVLIMHSKERSVWA